jgi:NAD-dependent deacetylase
MQSSPKPRLVVLSGAGISAESGLKTFRDSDGLWEGYAIEDVATPRAWKKAPQRVLDFYNERRRNIAAATPNEAHRGLAALEENFDVRIITQNIDDLHERAGSSHVLHLHGEIFRMRSEQDPELRAEIRGDIRLGDLAPDGAQYRPDIVWFEEPVPLIELAAREVSHAEIFVIVGTSLVVYPAAGLVHAVQPGTPIWVIDKKIPAGIRWPGLHEIELPATEGVRELLRALR